MLFRSPRDLSIPCTAVNVAGHFVAVMSSWCRMPAKRAHRAQRSPTLSLASSYKRRLPRSPTPQWCRPPAALGATSDTEPIRPCNGKTRAQSPHEPIAGPEYDDYLNADRLERLDVSHLDTRPNSEAATDLTTFLGLKIRDFIQDDCASDQSAHIPARFPNPCKCTVCVR